MNKVKAKILNNETVVLADEGAVVVNATFDAEHFPSQVEEGHGRHETGGMWLTTLTNVSLTIAGKTLPLLEMLNDGQKAAIIREIQEEHIPNLLNEMVS